MTVAAMLWTAPGCMTERSYPLGKGDVVRLAARNDQDISTLTARPWLRAAHQQIEHLLPIGKKKVLLTEDLLDETGRPIDVLGKYGLRYEQLDSLIFNFDGMSNSAQATGGNFVAGHSTPPWPGFEQVWIPIDDKLSLSGRLGFAKKDGEPIDTNCVVILPGIFGHNDISRTRDLAAGLVASGIHALALEMRGHGDTENRYPDVYYTFGALEAGDLQLVSEWLQTKPHVQRIGLVGFCWGANQALTTAWFDSRLENDPSISEQMAPYLRPVSDKPHFEAGIMVFSPVLRFEEVIEQLKKPHDMLVHPVLCSLQGTVEDRFRQKHHEKTHVFKPGDSPRSLRELIDCEFARSEMGYPEAPDDTMDFFRMLPFGDLPDNAKLRRTPVPLVIVHAADDPLANANDVAELIKRTPNPNVTAIVLPGGGHVGFAPFARKYFYSLVVNFFDPRTGPAAAPIPPSIAWKE
jgi:predicted alpha/beta-fold hydrolase